MSGLIDVVLHEHSAYPRSPVGDDAPEEEDVSLELVLFYFLFYLLLFEGFPNRCVESILSRSPLLALLSFSILACTYAKRTYKKIVSSISISFLVHDKLSA